MLLLLHAAGEAVPLGCSCLERTPVRDLLARKLALPQWLMVLACNLWYPKTYLVAAELLDGLELAVVLELW